MLESGRYILGPEVAGFEAEFAGYLGRRHCIGVANGTEAITIALRALGIRPGDEVVVPAYTFFATAEAVVNAGARPVFCDIDPTTNCVTAETVEPAISGRTRAIVPVHIFGNPAPVAELMELAASRDLVVLEDAAQAAGASIDGKMAGGLGHAAAFSFYPGKNLGAFGDGGAIVTDDEEVAGRARRLRSHGSVDKSFHTEAGYNSRLDEVQAAALRVLLPHLDRWTDARRRRARLYAESGLAEVVSLPRQTPGADAAFHLYVITTPRRDQLHDALTAGGIETRPYYTTPLHRQPAFRSAAKSASFPNAERLAAEGLALPMGPALDPQSVTRVASATTEALAAVTG